MGAQRGDNRKLYPFHDWKNSSQHDKSKWNSVLSLIGWSSLRKAESRLPIKDSSSFRVQWRLSDQETRSVWIRSNFSCGGVPAIGESQILCQERSGEWKGPPTCRGEGESPNPEIAVYRCLSSAGTSEN